MNEFLWQHSIDLLQDAAIEAAMIQWKKDTGAFVNRNTMLKIIIMKYGANMSEINKILSDKKIITPLLCKK